MRLDNASTHASTGSNKARVAASGYDALASSTDRVAEHVDPSVPRLCSGSLLGLYAGQQFKGAQVNKQREFPVTVDVKSVDEAESRLCGYLTIHQLTEQHPVLTTYFEGEVIGAQHGFLTRKWNADADTDYEHWSRFDEWLPFANRFNDDDFHYDWRGEEKVFMRWKEYFLVPDHHVTYLPGASYDGFYYICFDRRSRQISGLYYSAPSDRYQSLRLKQVQQVGSATFSFT